MSVFCNIFKKPQQLQAVKEMSGGYLVTLESSALWQNYTVTPINYGDGGSKPWSKNNIKDLFFAWPLLSWPPAICCTHLELLPHKNSVKLDD